MFQLDNVSFKAQTVELLRQSWKVKLHLNVWFMKELECGKRKAVITSKVLVYNTTLKNISESVMKC